MTPFAPFPLQLGLVIDAPALLGTLLIGGGTLLIMYWHLERNVLAAYLLPDAPATRHFLTFPFVVCIFIAIGAFAVYIDRLWFLALILYLLGRIMEAAVAVRTFRKIAYYLTKGLGWLGLADVESSGKSKREHTKEFILKRLWKMWVRLLISLMAIGLAGAVLVYTLLSFGQPLSDSLLLAWGVYMGISIGGLLLYHIRTSFLTLETISILGIVLCVTGAELFRFPQGSFALAPYVPGVSEAFLVHLSGFFPRVSVWDAALIVLGQIGFIVGFMLSLFFWGISIRRTPF